MANELRMSGKDVKATITLDGVPQGQSFQLKSCTVEEVVEQIRDDRLGSATSEVDEIPSGFNAKVEMYTADNALTRALLAEKAKRAANQPFKQLGLALLFARRDGGFDGFNLSPLTSKISLASSGRKERVMTSLDLQADTFVPVAL